MHYKFPHFVLVALLAFAFVTPALAQTFPKDKQAEVVFDIRMNKLRGNALFDSMRDTMSGQVNIPEVIDFEKVQRMFGAMSLPDSVADFQAMETENEMRFEFFARMVFVDDASADDAIKQLAENAETVEKNGKTYYKPNSDENAPEGMMAHRYDDKTIEIGTEFYLDNGTGKKCFTEGLIASWGKVPDHAIRICVDLDNSRALINEAVEQAKQDAPPMAGGVFELLNKAQSVRVSLDLNSAQLVSLGITGPDEDTAEELRSGLDALLGMGKMMGGQMVPMLEQQNADAARVVKAILNSLAATREGSEIMVEIPKPEGFEEAVQNLMKMQSGGGDF